MLAEGLEEGRWHQSSHEPQEARKPALRGVRPSVTQWSGGAGL